MPDRIRPQPVTHRLRLRALAPALVALVGLAAATTAACRTCVWGSHRAAPPRVHFDDLPPVHDAVAPGWTAAGVAMPLRLEPPR